MEYLELYILYTVLLEPLYFQDCLLKRYVRGKFDILIFRKGTQFHLTIYANSHGLTSFFQNQCKSSCIP